MKAYSLDLRERVVNAYKTGTLTIKAVATQFRVGETFVKKMLRQERKLGVVQAYQHGGGRRRALNQRQIQKLQRILHSEPDLTLVELQEKLLAEEKLQVSIATLARVLSQIGLPRKKSRHLPESATTINELGIGGE
jgi:transposase